MARPIPRDGAGDERDLAVESKLHGAGPYAS